MKEIWKIVADYPRYKVSNFGRVRAEIAVRGKRVYPAGLLTPFLDGKGYPSVNLVDGKRRSRRTVHSLVATAFIGPCPKNKEVCHKDGTRTNCLLSNLRYGTRSENYADSLINGKRRRG